MAAVHTLVGAAVLAVASWAHGQTLPQEVAPDLPQAQLAGQTRMRFLGMGIYDAKLWTISGFKPERFADYPFALELGYLRSLNGKAIAERSLEEMRRAGSINPDKVKNWLAAMAQAFPDVKASDRITGMHIPGVGARFWFNGKPQATIADPEFSRLFFGIWLATTTSEPRLRTELLARIQP